MRSTVTHIITHKPQRCHPAQAFSAGSSAFTKPIPTHRDQAKALDSALGQDKKQESFFLYSLERQRR
jgi:hypothetical protein